MAAPRILERVDRWLPPVLLMALIFWFSAQPDLNSGLGTLDTVLRKLVHMAEFGALFLLWWRAFDFRREPLAAAIAVLYAASDEWHQSFVEGRVGAVSDVAIDAAGVGLAVLLALRLRTRGRRRSAA